MPRTIDLGSRRAVLVEHTGHPVGAVETALRRSSILESIKPHHRIALKPNLTFPEHRPGVTTTPQVIREVVRILSDFTPHIAIVETDGGYGAWPASEAFQHHGLFELRREFGVEVVNLCAEESEGIEFESRGRPCTLPLPTRLLHATDLMITLPVPKIHGITGLSLAYKNQWGCIPDVMRLRRHYIFDDAIVAINRALQPAVLGDGTFFLDRNGPMEGEPVLMNLIIAATDAGAFDRYVSELMGWSWRDVPHLTRAVQLSDMPSAMDEIELDGPCGAGERVFTLRRTARNRIALAGFRSRFLTWLGYESWFGRVILHFILYAIAGKPVERGNAAAPVEISETA